MDNVKQAVAIRGTGTLRGVEHEEMFMERRKWRALFCDRP